MHEHEGQLPRLAGIEGLAAPLLVAAGIKPAAISTADPLQEPDWVRVLTISIKQMSCCMPAVVVKRQPALSCHGLESTKSTSAFSAASLVQAT